MKVLFSQLKKYLPELTVGPKEVVDVFTLTGFMLDKFTEVEFNGEKDYFLDLEVRQNRADAFGVIGLARELAAYYKINLKLPETTALDLKSSYSLPITISAVNAVKRIKAVKINNIQIKESPIWLKEYLALYDINSINHLVDLTNYVMIETAHASHVFDTDLVGDALTWEINDNKYKEITTLNQQKVELAKDTLVISDGKRPLSLSFIGGHNDAVSFDTKNVVLEMAVYNGSVVRKNARELKIVTEASTRLEKFLDPESLPQAFEWLVGLILKECGGEIASEVFEQYIQKPAVNAIEVDLNRVQQIAGIEITYSESKDYLTNLGFEITEDNGSLLKVLRPINRLDIEIAQDVYEEIIRMKGFNHIPSNKLSTSVVKDITPSRINLMENITNILAANGLDEVRSWVLVDEKLNELSNLNTIEAVKVTNSINEEVPYLRKSIAVSLIGQYNNYTKNNVNPIELFEIGKVFSKKGSKYIEDNSLGILIGSKDINYIKNKLEILLRSLGLDNIEYSIASTTPESAHPLSCWEVSVNKVNLGIMYLSNQAVIESCTIAEINIDAIDNILNKNNQSSTYEVTKKIVTLDANITLDNKQNANSILVNKVKEIEEFLWSWNFIDEFKDDNNTKYTVRISYINLSDTEAKELHSKIFEV